MHQEIVNPPKNDSSSENLLGSRFLKKRLLQVRDYQLEIAKKCAGKNYLVSIPTGLGKTIIAILLSAIAFHAHPHCKIVVVAPTKPLILQHAESFTQFLHVEIDETSVLTGSIPSHKRKELFFSKQILFYTPQTLRNDLEHKRYGLEEVRLLIVDEAHKATGEYAYTQIAKYYHEMNPDGNILALTASPGSSQEKIQTLCENLYISTENIELRTHEDGDVQEYVKEMTIEKISVEKSAFMEEILPELREILKERLIFLMEGGFLEDYVGNPIDDVENLTQISQYLSLQLNKKILSRIEELKGSVIIPGTQDEHLYQALSVNAEVLRIFHMIKTTETQGLNVLLEYMEQMVKDVKKPKASKALKNLASDSRFYLLYKTMKNKAESDDNAELIHPKLIRLQEVIKEEFEKNPDVKILLFAELRDTITLIHNILKLLPDVYPVRFVGQKTKSKKDKGMSQKTQVQTLEQFKQGKYNVLVSTSVAEEGLDIAECDIVIFYDAVPSEIRLIQRKGRTARQREGKVIILYCKDSSDENNLRNSLSRLRDMQKNIKITKVQPTNPTKLEHIDKQEQTTKISIEPPQSSIDKFMDAVKQAKKESPSSKNAQLKLSTSKMVQVSDRLHPKFGLEDLLTKNVIVWKKESHFHSSFLYFIPSLAYEDTIALIIMNPSKLQQGRVDSDAFWTELKQLSQAFKIVTRRHGLFGLCGTGRRKKSTLDQRNEDHLRRSFKCIGRTD